MPLLTNRPELEVVLCPENNICERKWLLENIRGASGVLVLLSEKIDAEFLDTTGPQLRVVSTMSIGYEHADLAELSQRKIKFGYTPDVLTDAVADVALMLALMAGRNTHESIALVAAGHWPQFNWAPWAFCVPQLSTTPPLPARTAGFLGFGHIARATLARLPFGFSRCLYSGSPGSARDAAGEEALRAKHGPGEVRRVALAELARESDVVFVLTPGGRRRTMSSTRRFCAG